MFMLCKLFFYIDGPRNISKRQWKLFRMYKEILELFKIETVVLSAFLFISVYLVIIESTFRLKYKLCFLIRVIALRLVSSIYILMQILQLFW